MERPDLFISPNSIFLFLLRRTLVSLAHYLLEKKALHFYTTFANTAKSHNGPATTVRSSLLFLSTTGPTGQ